MPGVTAVGGGKELASVRADVDATGVVAIGSHSVAQHTKAHTRTRWQTLSQWLPLLAAVTSAVDGELLIDVVASHGVFDEDEDRIGVMRVERDGKAKLGGEATLDVDPFGAAIEALVNAAVILLV